MIVLICIFSVIISKLTLVIRLPKRKSSKLVDGKRVWYDKYIIVGENQVSVIQISKIQVRRGKKLSGNGVPQLSSAEFAWALDTQELYIGNGSLAEGSPYVGNTKILTEHDNILELANSYRYGNDDQTILYSVYRGLQNKIDEIEVSVVDFGAVPDGSTDCTAAFHSAFADLFLKTDDKLKKVLRIPNGVYLFSSTLKIPSRAILRGENQKETILEIGDNDIIFVTENETEPGSFTSSDIPYDIKIENLTIDHRLGQTKITSARKCEFYKTIWRGSYLPGDNGFIPENANATYNLPIIEAGGNITVSGSAVSSTIIQNFSSTYLATLSALVGILNADPIFSGIFFAEPVGTSLKISTLSSSALSSSISSTLTVTALPSSAPGTLVSTVTPSLIEFTDGSQNINASVYWDNDLFGIRTSDTNFTECQFLNTKLATECKQIAIFETVMTFSNCFFNNCDTGIYVNGITNQENRWRIENCEFRQIASHALNFTAGIGTQLINCRFISCGTSTSTSQYPVTSIVRFGQPIENVVIDCSSDRHRLSGITSLIDTKGWEEYEGASFVNLIDRNYSPIYLSDSYRPLAVFSSENNSIVLNYILTLNTHTRTGIITMTIDTANSSISVADNYTYSSGGSIMTNFQFDAELRDNDNDSGNETVLLKYVNPLSVGSTGSISYSLSYGV